MMLVTAPGKELGRILGIPYWTLDQATLGRLMIQEVQIPVAAAIRGEAVAIDDDDRAQIDR